MTPACVAARLARQQLLLVLDNCEHVLDAVAQVCPTVLLSADDVRILATSREPLGLPEEARYRLPPLALPARQRSLDAAVDWSYQLLTAPEQRVFRNLSVFPGPFGLDAAEAVAGTDASPAVLHLVDCSLLVPPATGPDGRSRYSMLETLRAFGLRQLERAGEGQAAAAALAAHAHSVAERAVTQLARRDQELSAARWLAVAEAEHLDVGHRDRPSGGRDATARAGQGASVGPVKVPSSTATSPSTCSACTSTCASGNAPNQPAKNSAQAALPRPLIPPGAWKTTSSASTPVNPSMSWALNVSVPLTNASCAVIAIEVPFRG